MGVASARLLMFMFHEPAIPAKNPFGACQVTPTLPITGLFTVVWTGTIDPSSPNSPSGAVKVVSKYFSPKSSAVKRKPRLNFWGTPRRCPSAGRW